VHGEAQKLGVVRGRLSKTEASRRGRRLQARGPALHKPWSLQV